MTTVKLNHQLHLSVYSVLKITLRGRNGNLRCSYRIVVVSIGVIPLESKALVKPSVIAHSVSGHAWGTLNRPIDNWRCIWYRVKPMVDTGLP